MRTEAGLGDTAVGEQEPVRFGVQGRLAVGVQSQLAAADALLGAGGSDDALSQDMGSVCGEHPAERETEVNVHDVAEVLAHPLRWVAKHALERGLRNADSGTRNSDGQVLGQGVDRLGSSRLRLRLGARALGDYLPGRVWCCLNIDHEATLGQFQSSFLSVQHIDSRVPAVTCGPASWLLRPRHFPNITGLAATPRCDQARRSPRSAARFSLPDAASHASGVSSSHFAVKVCHLAR